MTVSEYNTVTYLVEEMKSARQRIDAEITTMNQFEVLCLTSIGAIYFLFFQFRIVDHGRVVFLASLPVLISAYGLFRYRAHADIVKIHEEYIKTKIEKYFYETSDHGGLVGYYDAEKRGLLKLARLSFWTLVFLLSFSILVLATFCPELLTRIIPLHIGPKL